MKKKNTRIRRRKYNSRKKFIFPLICLCILLGVSVVGVFAVVAGDTFTDEATGLKYKIIQEEKRDDEGKITTNGTVAITGYDKIADGKDTSAFKDGVLTIPATVKYTDTATAGAPEVEYHIVSIGTDAFSGNTNLRRVDVTGAAHLYKIEQRAFKDCTSLDRILMGGTSDNPGKVTHIFKEAFMGCGSLATVSFPDGIELISQSAFENCVNLTKVFIDKPTNLDTIGSRAFYNCPWLTDFPKISENTTIESGAFWGCCYINANKFPEGSDPFNKAAIIQHLGAQLRGTSLPKIIPSEGKEVTSVTNTTPYPTRFFKGQSYHCFFTPAGEYKIKGLDLLGANENIPTTYAISSEFNPNTEGLTEYKFTVPAEWAANSFVIFAAATKDKVETGAPTILTKELPPGLETEPYKTILECSSESPITEWSVGWRYANEGPGEIRQNELPAGLELKPVEGSTTSKYIATDELTGTGQYIITVTVKNAVSSHTKSFDLGIYDQTLPEMTELKWKESNGNIFTVWTPLQNTTAQTINYTIDIYKDGVKVAQEPKPLPGTETFESNFAEYEVTKILEENGKGIYTFTVTAESDGYARSFADSKSFKNGYYAYGYENYTITATAENSTGTGKISLSEASYNIESLKDTTIPGGLEVKVREGTVTPNTPLTFIFTPDPGCEITALTVDGEAVTDKNLESYTFTDLPELKDESAEYDREIVVEFSMVDNRIGGEVTETSSYVQGEHIDFEAIGQNMDATGAASGDTRWVPKFWSLDKAADAAVTHHWDGPPYTDTIDTTNLKFGDHTLYVTFHQQRNVAGKWQDVEGSHAVDVRSVEFTVTDKSGDVPDDPSGDDPSGGDTSGGTSGGGSGTSGGTSGGSGSVMDTVTSFLSGVDTSDNMMLGLWSALALSSLCGIGFCIRQMFKYA